MTDTGYEQVNSLYPVRCIFYRKEYILYYEYSTRIPLYSIILKTLKGQKCQAILAPAVSGPANLQ